MDEEGDVQKEECDCSVFGRRLGADEGGSTGGVRHVTKLRLRWTLSLLQRTFPRVKGVIPLRPPPKKSESTGDERVSLGSV